MPNRPGGEIMKKYEMLLLLNSEMTEEAREAELKKYADIVTSMGGNVEAPDKCGVK
ncbi:MAG: 30S ribosomal protein S6, partial [Clostridiales bacterium]|nr:30S ribosomal protein S6 [Clostridiales bacterium]